MKSPLVDFSSSQIDGEAFFFVEPPSIASVFLFNSFY